MAGRVGHREPNYPTCLDHDGAMIVLCSDFAQSPIGD